MSSNTSLNNLLTLITLDLSSTSIYPAFLLSALTYLMIVLCNLLVLTTIAVSKTLHKPMFILLFNLPVSDIIGATAFFPQLLLNIAMHSRLIPYPACVLQAFLLHMYGVANLLTLSAMAYDRFIAICVPLRYNSIMTSNRVITIIVLIWLIDLSTMLTLFTLLTRVKTCRRNIVDLYCNNPSLVKLVCESTAVNNFYGLAIIALLQGGPLLLIFYTYAQILHACLRTNQTEARRKAIQTCSTHLIVFLILQINTVFTFITHRIPASSPVLRRALGVSVLIFPPLLDPIIYGLKTKELKKGIVMLLKRNVVSTK